MMFPWKEREYGPPPHMGGKEKCSAPEAWPETRQGKGSTDEQSWCTGGRGAGEHFILHPSITQPCLLLCRISDTALLSDEGCSYSQDGSGHKQCLQDSQKVERAELKSNPSFPRSFLG